MWAGVVLSAIGVGLLRLSWRQKKVQMQLVKAAAWASIFASIPLFNSHTNTDFGTSMAFISFMLIGLAFIAFAAYENRGAASEPRQKTESKTLAKAPFNRLLFARRAYIVLLAGPVAGAAAIGFSVQLYGWLQDWGWLAQNQVFMVMLMGPLLWTIYAILLTTHSSLKTRNIIAAVLLAFSIIPIV